MKKLIAISVMCVLVIGAAFAETTLGGKIHIGGQILNGTNVEGSTPGTGEMTPDWYNTTLAVNFGDSKAGGKLSIHNKSPSFYDYFVWWRPIPQLRMQVGVNADGDFGTAEITGWGFTGEAKNGLGAINEYSGPIFGLANSRRGFYDGSGETTNVAFSIFPIDGLTINLWIPLKGENAALTFAKTEVNAVYVIEEIGKVKLSFQGNTGYVEGQGEDSENKWYGADGITNPAASPKFFLSFYLSAIENMGIDLGLAYKLPFNNEKDKILTNHPFEIGLGYRWVNGDLTLKLRSAMLVGGSVKKGDRDPVNDPVLFSVNVLPSYKIAGMTVFLYAGLGIQAVEDWEKTSRDTMWDKNQSNAVVSWFINPYLHIPAGDGLRFQVGLQIYSSGVMNPYYIDGDRFSDGAQVNWAIPFGFYMYL